MLKYFKKTYSTSEKELFDFLASHDLFADLSYDQLDKFQPYIYKRSYKENEVVFFGGDPSHALYILKYGEVTLNLDVRGEFEMLQKLKNSGVFGDNALLENTKRLYSAIVVSEKADLLVIPKVNLMEVMDHHPTIKGKLMANFANIYNRFTSRLFDTYRGSQVFFDLNTVYS